MGIGHCDFGVRRVRQVVIPGRFVLVSGSYLDTLVDIGYRPPLRTRIVEIALVAVERLAQYLLEASSRERRSYTLKA
jgi:hypothetical protein